MIPAIRFPQKSKEIPRFARYFLHYLWNPLHTLQRKSELTNLFIPVKKGIKLAAYYIHQYRSTMQNPVNEERLELRVLSWLTDKGYNLIKRNWEYCNDKVDIIASHLGQLHFISITTKKYPENGLGSQGFTRRKMLSFMQASQQYLQHNPQWKKATIDVLTVTMLKDEPMDCVLTKDLRMT